MDNLTYSLVGVERASWQPHRHAPVTGGVLEREGGTPLASLPAGAAEERCSRVHPPIGLQRLAMRFVA